MRQVFYSKDGEPTQLDRIEAMLKELLKDSKESKAPKKRVSKPAGSKVVYWDFFDAVWSTYPKRAGNNPKNKAFAAFKARSNASDDKNINMIMAQGVNRYAAYCDAVGFTHTERVMHGATFFGPSDPPNYSLDWAIPASAKRESLPRNDEDLQAFAVKHNMHPPGQAPRNIQNNHQYRQWIQDHL